MQLANAITACGNGGITATSILTPIAPHVLHPLIQACHTKDPKVVQVK